MNVFTRELLTSKAQPISAVNFSSYITLSLKVIYKSLLAVTTRQAPQRRKIVCKTTMLNTRQNIRSTIRCQMKQSCPHSTYTMEQEQYLLSHFRQPHVLAFSVTEHRVIWHNKGSIKTKQSFLFRHRAGLLSVKVILHQAFSTSSKDRLLELLF